MKKKIIIATVIVLVVILGLVIFGRITTYNINAIPLFPKEYVFYCMTPGEAAFAFGSAQNVTPSVCDTPDVSYAYARPVLGHEADVECFFADNSCLHRISVMWSLESDEEANALYEEVLSQIREKHGANDDFYEKEETEPDKEAKTTSIGVNYGATGVSYSVFMEGCTVSVWGYYMV